MKVIQSNQLVAWLALLVAVLSSGASAYQAYTSHRVSQFPFLANLQSQQLTACLDFLQKQVDAGMALHRLERITASRATYSATEFEALRQKNFENILASQKSLVPAFVRMSLLVDDASYEEMVRTLKVQETFLEMVETTKFEQVSELTSFWNRHLSTAMKGSCARIAVGNKIGIAQ